MLSGPDGTGKSTISNAVINLLKNNNDLEVKHIWLRFNHYTAKFVNLIGRLTGKSYYESYDWGKLGYHDYYGLIGVIYVLSIYIDHIFFYVFLKHKFLKSNQNYLIDRFIIDVIADLIVDTKRNDLIFFLLGPFLRIELNKSHAFILECDESIVISRRIDITDDKRYGDKIKAYKEISSKFNIIRLNTGLLSIEEVTSKIVQTSL